MKIQADIQSFSKSPSDSKNDSLFPNSEMLAKPRLSLLPERILPPPVGPGGAEARIRWKGSDKLRLLSRDSASWPRAPPARRVSDNGGAGGREVVRSGRYFEVWIR